MSTLIGTAPDQVPVNGMLGDMAFQSKAAVTIETLTSKGTTTSDAPTLGTEIITSSASWTASTGWTGDNTTGWVHATGNSGTLTYPTAAVSGTRYQIAYTVTSYSAGSFTVTFGGQSNATIIATGTFGPTATSTGNLVITPTSDFVGTIIISIKSLTAVSTPVISLKDSTNTVRFEQRVNSTLYNTFLGLGSGRYNTTGYYNSGIGFTSLYNNTTGSSNVAIGDSTLSSNTIGGSNIAVGSGSLQNNISGTANTAVGNVSLANNTTGVLNNAFGYVSLNANTTGSSNNAFGRGSLQINTTGGNNNAFGRNTLQANVTSSGNCAFGDLALTLSTGTNNSAFGYNAGSAITTGSNNIVIGGYTGAAAPISATGSNYIVLSDGAGNVRQVIDSSGNVGIGTSSPYSQLDVYSVISSPTLGEASGVGTIRITNGASALTSAGGLEFKIAGDSNGYGSKIQALNSAGSQLVFANRGASATWIERMRIDSSGNVGIGIATSIPSQFTVSGTGQLVSAITDAGVGTGTIQIHSTSSSAGAGGALLFSALTSVGQTTPQWAIKSLLINGGTNGVGDLVFSGRAAVADTALTERMRFDSAGNATLQKNISVGAAAPTTVGTGITFPATQSASSDANTLDDYEEGTWTPVLTFVTNGTMTYTASTASGVYTKIGNVVTCRAALGLSAFTAGTASGQARISLPFTSAQNYFSASTYANNFTTTYPTLLLSAGGVSYVNVYGNTAINTAPVGIAPANFSATSSIFFSITYTAS